MGLPSPPSTHTTKLFSSYVPPESTVKGKEQQSGAGGSGDGDTDTKCHRKYLVMGCPSLGGLAVAGDSADRLAETGALEEQIQRGGNDHRCHRGEDMGPVKV